MHEIFYPLLLCLLFAPVTKQEAAASKAEETRTPRTKPAAFPDTVAGRLADAFFEAFNTGDADAMRAFELKHRTARALEERPVEDRVEQYRMLYEEWGKLRVLNVVERSEQDISITARAEKAGAGLEFQFDLEAPPSNKLIVIRITPTVVGLQQPSPDLPKVGSAAENQALKIASLADSLQPLRDRFNADRDKPRFIAILSPT